MQFLACPCEAFSSFRNGQCEGKTRNFKNVRNFAAKNPKKISDYTFSAPCLPCIDRAFLTESVTLVPATAAKRLRSRSTGRCGNWWMTLIYLPEIGRASCRERVW